AVVTASGIPAAAAQELTFSVAISMKDATEELGRRFTQSRPGVVLRYNFGASGDLQKQIEAGAPIDLFISAAQRQMGGLEKKGLTVAARRMQELEKRGVTFAATGRFFARNVLTVIKPADSKVDVTRAADLLDPRV